MHVEAARSGLPPYAIITIPSSGVSQSTLRHLPHYCTIHSMNDILDAIEP